MAATHAKLSPSAAHRWLACPPSAALEATLVALMGETTTTYAEEGTVAHALADLELRRALKKKPAPTKAEFKAVQDNGYYNAEMQGYIDAYVTDIIAIKAEVEAGGQAVYIDLEQQVEFSDYVPEGFGTADVTMIYGTQLKTIDFKYGKGVPVDAHKNPQLMLYSLGAYLKYRRLFDLTEASCEVHQPRLGSRSVYTIPVPELLAWAEGVVRPLAELAYQGQGGFNPSEDTCRFCKAKQTCRARAEQCLIDTRSDFALPPLLSVEEVAGLLPRLEMIENWARQLQEYALTEARDNGVAFSGYKLVEGRSVRVLSDKDAAVQALKVAKLKKADYLKPEELKGLTDLEKALGKPRFNELLGQLISKPPGKPVLVPESDKRPAIAGLVSAQADFS
jgi:hypothetical protein